MFVCKGCSVTLPASEFRDNPDKLTGRKLALKFGVSPATICLIRKGQRWAHVG